MKLRGYRIQTKKLWGLVGGKQSAKLKKPGIAVSIVDEIATNRLNKAHARHYRALLDTAATSTGRCVGELTTSADPGAVGKTVRGLGAVYMAKDFGTRTCPWPWMRGAPRIKGSWASHWSPAETTYRAGELANVNDAAITDEEIADVVRCLRGMFKRAKGASLLLVIDS